MNSSVPAAEGTAQTGAERSKLGLLGRLARMSMERVNEGLGELQEAFALFEPVEQTTTDVVGDESTELVIKAEQLGSIMRRLNVPALPNELADMIEDADGGLRGHDEPDGALDFPEFLQLISRKINDSSAKSELQEAFQVFDRDGNGYISANELCNVMNNLGIELPNDDGTPMSEAEVEELISDWTPDRRRHSEKGMSWERFWSEIQSVGSGVAGTKKRGRVLADKTSEQALSALQRARHKLDTMPAKAEHEDADEYEARKKEHEAAVAEAQQHVRSLHALPSEMNARVRRMDAMRFAAEDHVGLHQAVKLGFAGQIEQTMRTRTLLGTRLLTVDAAKMARRLSLRLATEGGTDTAIDLSEIKDALMEFDRNGDRTVFMQELGIVSEVLHRRPMHNTVARAVAAARDAKIDLSGPWHGVGSPPWGAGAAGCTCTGPALGLPVLLGGPFVGCTHDAQRDGNLTHEKHTQACLLDGESWSAFCVRRAELHGYRPPRRTGTVSGSSCAFCCVAIQSGEPYQSEAPWARQRGGGWIKPALKRPQLDPEEPADPRGLWSHIWPADAQWRAGKGLPQDVCAVCEDCNERRATFVHTEHGKVEEMRRYKAALEDWEDAARQGIEQSELELLEQERNVAEKRTQATAAAEKEGRMRWCAHCKRAHDDRMASDAGVATYDKDAVVCDAVGVFHRARKPQKLLQEIRRAACAMSAKHRHGEMRDRLLRSRVLEEDKLGFTPMHCAARDGKLQCVRALLVQVESRPDDETEELSVSVPPHWLWCSSMRGAARCAIDDAQLAQISRDSKTTFAHYPEGTAPWNHEYYYGEQDVGTSTEAGPSCVVIAGRYSKQLWTGVDPPTMLAKRKLAAARIKYYLNELREELQQLTDYEKECAAAAMKAKAEARNAADAVMHQERAITFSGLGEGDDVDVAEDITLTASGASLRKKKLVRSLTSMGQASLEEKKRMVQEDLAELKEKDAEATRKRDELRAVWRSCIEQANRSAQRIAEVEVDYQMQLPPTFETSHGRMLQLSTADVMGYTPLHWACRNGHLDVARLLLSMGAHPTAKNLAGKTPLDEARSYAQARSFLFEGATNPAELAAMKEGLKKRQDLVKALREECPLMDDRPMPAGARIFVEGHGRGSYVSGKSSSGFSCFGKAARALHTIDFDDGGPQQLALTDMQWRIDSGTAPPSVHAATTTFDALPAAGSAAEPKQSPDEVGTPSKYLTGDRAGTKLPH